MPQNRWTEIIIAMAEEISFGAFVFWMGIGAVSVGLYFWIEGRQRKRNIGIALTVIGVLCSLSVVKEVRSLIPNIRFESWLGIVLLLVTWGALGYDIYIHKFHGPPQAPKPSKLDLLRKRPSIGCASLSTFGMYSVLPNIIGAGIRITNNETRYQSTAHNVRASISFRHAMGDEFVVNPGVFWDEQADFVDHISLSMGEQTTLLILCWNSQGHECNFRSVNRIPPDYDAAAHLEYGEWDVDITFTGDNVAYEHKITLTLPPRGGIGSVVRA